MKRFQLYLVLMWLVVNSTIGLLSGARGAVLKVPDEYLTIQAGINAAVDGDTVLVMPGYYYENIIFQGKEITVASSSGPDQTIIHGQATTSVVRFIDAEGSGTALEGFTISFGDDTRGGGIYGYNASPIISMNIISQNIADERGGGIFLNSGASQIIDNKVQYNSAETLGGGGVFIWFGRSTIIGNEITENQAPTHGGGLNIYNTSMSSLTNNLIYSNSSGQRGGGVIANKAEVQIFNNTITDNTADDTGGGIAFVTNSNISFKNNIVANNTRRGIFSDGTSQVLITYNDVWNNTGGNYDGLSPGYGDISEDPLFIGGVPFDYHLSPGSPCIDAGDPADTPPPGGGARIDMGAFEFLYTLHVYPTDFELLIIEGGVETIHDSLFLVSYMSEQASFELSTGAGWIDLDPMNGEIGEGESDTIEVVLDGTLLEPGLYVEEISVWIFGEAIDTTITVPVSLRKYPADPAGVELVCENPFAPRGGSLEFDAVLTNNMDSTVTFEGWLELMMINGEPYLWNPLLGPGDLTLSPLSTVTLPVSLDVPGNAPLGGNYTMYGLIGFYGILVIDESSFEFAVTP